MKTLFCMLLAGCAAQMTHATEVVWRDVYRVQNCPAPRVELSHEAAGYCALGWANELGHCVRGEYFRYSNTVVLWPEAIIQKPSETVLTHELLHAALDCWGIDEGDANHKAAAWDWLLKEADRKLAREGL